jgi:fido (protein-threonine AMPylation protein)
MWQQMRAVVLEHIPPAILLPKVHQILFKEIDDIYLTDAYHSLSIERYKVTPELIEKVSSGKWNLKGNIEDRKQRDAMAARGYYQAFLAVKASIKSILEGGNPGAVANNQHSKWYRELFDPSVAAGILRPSDLAGYRSHQVYIGNSKHLPLSVDAMRDAMPVLFELLEEEKEAAVRAVLGHFIFVFIHPYMDGNGRIGRFLMNVMFVTGGYPWIVIPFENRDEYMKTLESASVDMDIEPFAKFIGILLKESQSGNRRAILP